MQLRSRVDVVQPQLNVLPDRVRLRIASIYMSLFPRGSIVCTAK